jgi:N-acetylmuramoyl-L-alanine amidase
MTHLPRFIPVFITLLLAVAQLSFSSHAYAAKKSSFKWESVTYNGGSFITVRSIKNFYRFEQTHQGKSLILKNTHVQMELEIDSQNCRINGVLFILSHPIVPHKGRYLLSYTDLLTLIDPILRPNYIKHATPFKTVVIDAGHGGKDPGSRGRAHHEKYYNLKIARLLRDKLQERGYNVVMTRDSDTFISLANRVRIANKYSDAIFISIHFNSGQSKAHGIETFTVSPISVPHLGRGYRARDARAVPGNISGSASVALATAEHSRTLTYLNNAKNGNNFHIADRGIKHARFNVLTGIKIPAILLEGGFLSNRKEEAKINTPAYQKTLAAAVVHAIDIYKNSISHGKTTEQKNAKKKSSTEKKSS